MTSYVIATVKSWNMQNFYFLKEKFPEYDFILITDKKDLTYERLEEINPRFVFFPHWSWIIPEQIYSRFNCVVFHMTDLPFGRGGSPLQNLLVRGIYDTKVSAIRVKRGMDTGPVYLKKPLDISCGNADDILKRVSSIVFNEMIPAFLQSDIACQEQEGKPVAFKRRLPEQSEIPSGLSQRQIYDYIRMLDGEGYPAAFVKAGQNRIYFRNARYEGGKVSAEAFFGGG